MVDEPTRAAGEEPFERCDEQPQFVGPFRLLERIGAGGMGVVHLAERREPVAQRVALKVIRTDRLDRTYRARFAMEQDALARMDHSNIARLLDAGDSNGQSWFAMEFVPGQPLTDYCREHRLSVEQRLQLFVQICDGVQHAHIKGILHRDLKPGNILVREVDGRPVAKIIDFGLAQPVDPLQIRATLHEAVQQVVGTFAYMSPEQATRTEGDLDTRTDVYSLGAVLYELLTGELPLDLEDVKKRGLAWFGTFLREHEPQKPSTRLSELGERLPSTAAERATSPARLQSSVRGDLDWVTMKALARDRQRRYLTVRDLGREVERVLAHRPVDAGPPSAWYVAKKWVRRHVVGVGVVGVLIAATAALWTSESLAAAEHRRLEMGASLDMQLLAAPGLVEEAERLGAEANGRARIDVWLDACRRLLGDEVAQRGRDLSASPARLAAVRRHLDEVLPQLATAQDTVLQLREQCEAIADAMAQHATAWQTCVAAIEADPRYGVRRMVPQFGLVPLGPDPRTGLQEFVCLAAGAVPSRDPVTGELQLDEDSGLVLVLVPGGTFRMGTPADALSAEEARATAAERPARDVELASFFIGKGEVTGLHCLHVLEDPSEWGPEQLGVAILRARKAGTPCPKPDGFARGMPIGNVDWGAARRIVVRLGLRLPTEAEWEYAARAGTTGQWSCDATLEALRRHANLADASLVAAGLRTLEADPAKLVGSDSLPCLAPIHSLAPNSLGLHDMHGNVAEWCECAYRDLDPVSTLQFGDDRVVRGGSFRSAIDDSRSAARRRLSARNRQGDVGLRAARSLEGCEFTR